MRFFPRKDDAKDKLILNSYNFECVWLLDFWVCMSEDNQQERRSLNDRGDVAAKSKKHIYLHGFLSSHIDVSEMTAAAVTLL